jgi:hypothetical protein
MLLGARADRQIQNCIMTRTDDTMPDRRRAMIMDTTGTPFLTEAGRRRRLTIEYTL